MPIINVLLPQFGMGMQDGEVVRWCKAVGDRVAEGEALLEIEAAKSTVEVPSPCAGELIEILAEVGDTIEVRSPVAKLRTD